MPKPTVSRVPHQGLWYALSTTRMLLGFVFLWAFFDKLFGLGFATPAEKSWLSGASPTTGFLKFGTGSTFGDFFKGLAGDPAIDWLFMLGLLGVGVGLMLGIALRISAVAGSMMLLLMWLALQPLENNPVVDEHIIYIGILATLAFSVDHQKFSLQNWWRKLPVVRDSSLLW